MPDIITAAERAAIEAYTGQITACPPCTFSEVVEHKGYRQAGNAMARQASRERSASTGHLVNELAALGCDVDRIARQTGLHFTTVKKHLGDKWK